LSVQHAAFDDAFAIGSATGRRKKDKRANQDLRQAGLGKTWENNLLQLLQSQAAPGAVLANQASRLLQRGWLEGSNSARL
jgi:hypothetical protein